MSETETAEAAVDADTDAQPDETAAKQTLMTSDTKEANASSEGGESAATEADSDPDVSEHQGAPEDYEAFTLPEGFELDTDLSERFNAVAKELNLSQDQAQKLVDMQTSQANDASTKSAEAWANLRDQWQTEAKTDKEFGGKDFDKNIGTAKLALNKYGNEELSSAIEMTGMGNHPEFIRLLYKVGLTLKEDKLMVEGGGPVVPTDRGKILFPDMN
tara:strand:- start:7972 stop:8619 length:648 start_codon:yes stop_codon:yes gene_type:complete